MATYLLLTAGERSGVNSFVRSCSVKDDVFGLLRKFADPR